MIVTYLEQIFDTLNAYFDIKKMIGIPKKRATIPDNFKAYKSILKATLVCFFF